MSLTFQIMTLEKYLTKSFEFLLWGTPILTNPALPMTPLFRQRACLHTWFCACVRVSVRVWSANF